VSMLQIKLVLFCKLFAAVVTRYPSLIQIDKFISKHMVPSETDVCIYLNHIVYYSKKYPEENSKLQHTWSYVNTAMSMHLFFWGKCPCTCQWHHFPGTLHQAHALQMLMGGCVCA
jgi:hypothetical protein